MIKPLMYMIKLSKLTMGSLKFSMQIKLLQISINYKNKKKICSLVYGIEIKRRERN